jgi:chromosome partitioning protein
MAKVIAVANRKGGVGKTTTAICLAFFLGRRGKKVLLLDVDPQNALWAALCHSGEKGSGASGALEFVRGEASARDIVQTTRLPNVDLIPFGNPTPGGVVTHQDETLFAMPRKRAPFVRVVASLSKEYEYVIVDSPPGASALVEFALLLSDSVVIPLQCQPLALRIMPRILRDIKELIVSANPRLTVEGVLLTMYDFWQPISHEIADQVWSYFPKKSTFRAVIRKSPAFERIFDSEDNPLLQEELEEELLDYDVIADLIVAREGSPAESRKQP